MLPLKQRDTQPETEENTETYVPSPNYILKVKTNECKKNEGYHSAYVLYIK